ncbi:hypothetical protein ACFY1P_13600 [Streptomyces sp. NPDC001407]|uniref:hypothetical protein n=1 Tax=unclassified Streptomyces TaxID=2593676 RepID=UPI0033F73139
MSVLELPRRAEPVAQDDRTGALAEVTGLRGDLPPSAPRRRRGHLLGHALVACGLALLPWLFVLATSLPATTTASRWSAAWVGLDALEALALITTGLLAARRDRRHGVAAAATAALLVMDAWFDTMTAAPGADLVSALIMAVALELPLAVVCGALAVRASSRAS